QLEDVLPRRSGVAEILARLLLEPAEQRRVPPVIDAVRGFVEVRLLVVLRAIAVDGAIAARLELEDAGLDIGRIDLAVLAQRRRGEQDKTEKNPLWDQARQGLGSL